MTTPNKNRNEDLELKDLDQKAKAIGIGGNLISNKDEGIYKNRMQKRKEVQQQRLSKRDKEKGLVIIFTGNGKGKTTAALGMALRTIGHNHKVAIVQFIKGGWEPGESIALKAFDQKVKWHALGEGFTWETQDRVQDKKLVELSWKQAIVYLKNKEFKMVILDEINVAIKLGYISESKVLEGIKERPPLTHVVLTGRGASTNLIECADLVTEMKSIHHPFREKGVKAQKGIEY